MINVLPFELHIPGYQFCDPGTRLENRLTRGDQGINSLDVACREHDIVFAQQRCRWTMRLTIYSPRRCGHALPRLIRFSERERAAAINLGSYEGRNEDLKTRKKKEQADTSDSKMWWFCHCSVFSGHWSMARIAKAVNDNKAASAARRTATS